MKKLIVSLMFLFAQLALAGPTISSVLVTATTATTATIQWNTSTPSSSMLKYGTDPSLPYANNVTPALVTSHTMVLQLLSAGPLYYVAAVSADSTGSTQSSAITFSLCGTPLAPVQGTVTNYYEYGSYTLTWVPPVGYSQQPTVCGQPVQQNVSGSLDGGASFNTQVADASKVVPGPGQWEVQVTDAGNIAPLTIFAYLSQVTQNVSQQLQYAAANSGLQTCLTNTHTSGTWPPLCGGGGCGNQCALLNAANTFTQANSFPALTVINGINGLDLYENTGLLNIGIGVGSANKAATGAQNFGIGDGSLAALTSGFSNVGIGVATLGALTTGNQNGCVGDGCGASMTTAVGNIGSGANSLFSLVSGNANTAQGGGSCGDLTTGSNNVCIGSGALGTELFGVYTTVNNGIYMGYKAEPSANGNTNEIVISYEGLGHGSNTTTLGNTSTTAAYIYGTPNFPLLAGAGSGCLGISNTGAGSLVSCGSGGGGPTIQVNTTNLISATTVNFENGANVAITNPSAGNISIAVPTFPYSGLTGSVPTWNQSTTGNAATATLATTATTATTAAALSGTPTLCSTGSAPTGILANGNATGCQAISGGGGGATLQTNTSNNASQTLLNFTTTSTIAFTNPSGGVESAALVSPGASTLLSFNASNAYTGLTLGTGLGITANTLNNTGLTGTLSTSNCLLKQSGTTTATCGLATDSGTLLTIPEPVVITASTPGVIDIAAGTGNLLTAPANSYGWIAPATGGTPYDRQDPNTASSTGGLLLYGTPTTANNRNVIVGNWFHPEFPVTSGTGAWGTVAQYAVLSTGIANNNGHFTSISASTLNGGACTTPPQVAAFAGNTETAFITASTSENYQNSPVAITVSLPYTAGQNIGLVVEVAGATCPALMNFSAMTAEP